MKAKNPTARRKAIDLIFRASWWQRLDQTDQELIRDLSKAIVATMFWLFDALIILDVLMQDAFAVMAEIVKQVSDKGERNE